MWQRGPKERLWVGSMGSGASCGRSPQEPFREESMCGWMNGGCWVQVVQHRQQNTGGRVFKPFTKQILTLPQMAKDSTQAPHSGSWPGELLG